MADFYFWTMVAVLVGALARVMIAPEHIYQYSGFMAAAFAIFILPQAYSLLSFSGAASAWAVEAALFMAVLCLVMCLLSGIFPVSRWIIRNTQYPIRQDRLFHAGIFFTIVGYVATWLQSQVISEVEGLWTGSITIYNFFTLLLLPAFAICLRTALMRGGALPWLFTVLSAWPQVEAALFHGRRQPTALLLAVVGMTLFYLKRVRPPRFAVAGVIVLAMLVIPATGTYRSLAEQGGLSALRQLALIDNFTSYLNEASILELRNAAMILEATSVMANYEWGTGYWDELVWRYVPAQIVGADLKQGLMFQWADQSLRERLFSGFGYEMPTGTTITGMGDAFVQFGYFGSLFFLLLGIGMRSLWTASLRPQAIFAQLLYMCTVTSAMRAVTHETVDYLPGLLFYLIFIGIAVWYARDRPVGRRAVVHAIQPASPAHETRNPVR